MTDEKYTPGMIALVFIGGGVIGAWIAMVGGVMLFMGLVLGVAAGLLFAPQTGSETREQLKAFLFRAEGQIKHYINENKSV